MPKLVLASTSAYRSGLLSRLGLPFVAVAPETDESAREGEEPAALVARLAEAKARAVSKWHMDSLIIGSDQAVALNGASVGKPRDYETNMRQLMSASGRRVEFFTGLCLLNTVTNTAQIDVIPFAVHFRRLSRDQIHRYVIRERPYDCAGGFKSEGLGVALFERMEGDDPTALIGLPLIRLVTMLQKEGVDVFAEKP